MHKGFTPTIIQGGMGAGVSNWRLARAVSVAGQLGVVAGTALDVVLARRLQCGDPGGDMRRALARFPIPGVAERILERYFIPSGKAETEPFKALPLMGETLPREREELIVAANYVEVALAREGHEGPVGINFLSKIQVPTLPSLYGAMLAGVGYVLMGAGLPRSIPSILDDLAAGRPVSLALDVQGAEKSQTFDLRFDPASYVSDDAAALVRPEFLAIVSSVTAASIMVRKSEGRVDGLIVEGSTAGGHNAPPRGGGELNEAGEIVYGKRDVPDLSAIAKLGLPFWLAGSCASPEQLAEALRQGATGIQVGTAFAFCEESGIDPELKQRATDQIRSGEAHVATDHRASPTGFPFKVFQLSGTASEPEVWQDRNKLCDLGFLRHAYAKEDGSVAWRCPGEPTEIYLRKGGSLEETEGRKCVCNGLMANIGLAQSSKDGEREPALLTSGTDTSAVAELLTDRTSYSARDVLSYLLG